MTPCGSNEIKRPNIGISASSSPKQPLNITAITLNTPAKRGGKAPHMKVSAKTTEGGLIDDRIYISPKQALCDKMSVSATSARCAPSHH